MSKTQLIGYVDFNEVQVFGATVDTSIIFFQKISKAYNNYQFTFCQVNNDLQKNEPLVTYIDKFGFSYQSDLLNEQSFSFADSKNSDIKIKIEGSHQRLKNLKYKINYGIKTGYNDAFYLNIKQKNKIIAEDDNAGEFIKKLLRGRDISKYNYKLNDDWLLFTRRGFEIDRYPSIRKHLQQFRENLEPKPINLPNNVKWKGRKKGPYQWFEIQDNIAFFEDFKKPKIVWLELTNTNKFALCFEEVYVLAGAFILTGENLKFLLSVLNSQLCSYYFDLICNSSGMATNQWKKFVVEQIPIPDIPKTEMRPFEILVDYITFIKKYSERVSPYTPNDHMAANFEELVDACVYELYFKEHMEEKSLTVLKEVNQLLKPIDHLDEKTQADQIVKIINAVYDEYKSTDNIIRRRILDFPVKSPDIINIIQNG